MIWKNINWLPTMCPLSPSRNITHSRPDGLFPAVVGQDSPLGHASYVNPLIVVCVTHKFLLCVIPLHSSSPEASWLSAELVACLNIILNTFLQPWAGRQEQRYKKREERQLLDTCSIRRRDGYMGNRCVCALTHNSSGVCMMWLYSISYYFLFHIA